MLSQIELVLCTGKLLETSTKQQISNFVKLLCLWKDFDDVTTFDAADWDRGGGGAVIAKVTLGITTERQMLGQAQPVFFFKYFQWGMLFYELARSI